MPKMSSHSPYIVEAAPLPLVDIGINITNSQFEADAEAVLSRAHAANVTCMILTGTSIAGSQESLAFAGKHPGLWSTAGIHPHDASQCSDAAIDELRKIASADKVCAIGECGLDFNRNFSTREEQLYAFEAQLALAAELSMPVFVHERDAGSEVAALLKEWRGRIPDAVVHCFTGNRESLHRFLDLDLHIGITGWICDEKRGGHLRELVRDIPQGRLMIETDAPYLIPKDLPLKTIGRRNEPAFLAHIALAIAGYRGETVEQLCRHTTQTALRFFRIAAGD